MTVGEWCDKWLAGYGTRRASTVRQAEVHVKIIKAHFGSVPMSAVKPSGALGPFAISRRKLPNLHAASVRGFVGWARLDLLGQSGGEREHQALAQVIEWATLQVQFDLV